MVKRILACILIVALLSVSVLGAFANAEDFDPHTNGQADQGERDPHDEGGPDQGGPDQGGPKGEEAPASGFVTLVSDDGQVFWKMAVEDADKLYADSGWNAETTQVVRLVPDNEEAYPYLYPDRAWKIVFGTVKEEAEKPDWFTDAMETAVFEALDDWKNIVYSAFDYEAFRSLTAEDTISKAPASAEEVTEEALAVFRKYVTLEDSLCTFIKTSVNDFSD